MDASPASVRYKEIELSPRVLERVLINWPSQLTGQIDLDAGIHSYANELLNRPARHFGRTIDPFVPFQDVLAMRVSDVPFVEMLNIE